MVHMYHWKVLGKNQDPDSRDEKVICLLSDFRNSQTDIVSSRIAVCCQRSSLDPRKIACRKLRA